ncbi:CPBP family glutamic-type intramembrane protease [Spongiimicrobium salis]|uniref:CPBP family glutamic-type intramembrane protease n=1 Tax=Spongiimicrobium salis TaxID=1667022 RepID=UPI00374D2CB6
MNNNFLKTKFTPILAVIIAFIFFRVPLGLDYFETILATLVILIASFIEFGKELFISLGFQRNKLKIRNLLIIAPLVSGGLFLLYYFILIPGVGHFTGQPIDFSDFDSLKGNFSAALSMFLLIWVSAGFCEEIISRGYFMQQFTKFFGNSKLSIVLNILILSFIFGWLHNYQGITGQIITGILWVLLSSIFYFRKYDLWFNIAVHGFFDTIALIVLYHGGL